jgi:hypothetical protein
MAPLAGPEVIPMPDGMVIGLTEVAKGGHGQRKGLAYR